jgi:hypothetical protein
MSGVIVQVSARKFAVPFECPCCGAAPDTEMMIWDKTGRGFDFPYCAKCVAHVGKWESSRVLSSGITFLGLSAAVIAGLVTRQILIGLAVTAATIGAAVLVLRTRRKAATAARNESCSSAARAVSYLGHAANTTSFSFESPTYTARFAEQNEDKLVNVTTKLRKLLENHRVARLLVPTPAAPVTAVPSPPTLREWIDRIDAAPGVVARRNAVSRALEVVHDPADRRELVAAAARRELRDIVTHVDGLPNDHAKRRQLQRTIEDVRADNIPDEVQAEEVRQLEERLQRLA